jgi:hypothetical protein
MDELTQFTVVGETLQQREDGNKHFQHVFPVFSNVFFRFQQQAEDDDGVVFDLERNTFTY